MAVEYLGTALPSGAPAREAVQVYVAVPPVAGLVVPQLKLCAFAAVELAAGAGPAPVSFTVQPYDLTTVDAQGNRSLTTGQYVFYISGHSPTDAQGTARASNVVSVTMSLP